MRFLMTSYDIVFATPGSWVNASFVRSLTKTIQVLEDHGITWTFVNYESPYISGARERIITDGFDEGHDITVPFNGKFDYNKILWIDSDIQWEPNDVLALYYSDRDIVTGAYMMTSGRIAVSYDGIHHPFPNEIPTGRESKIATCGFGFLCVSKGVFENMPKPWFTSEVFEADGRLMAIMGEDSSWCVRARRAGYDIWLDPRVRVIHNKVMSLAWMD
jgi:hypothetical protein